MVPVTDKQGFSIINRRNALENPCNHSCSLRTLIQKAPDKVTRVFKGVLMIVVTDEQGFYIINRRNALENLCNHSCSLRTPIQKALDKVT